MKKSHLAAISMLGCFVLYFTVNAFGIAPSHESEFSPTNNWALAGDCDATRKAANNIIDKLVANDYEGVRAGFNESLKSNLSAEQIKSVWGAVKGDLGEYKSREKSLYQEYPASIIVFTRLQMEKGRISVEVHFADDGKVGGFWIKPA